MEQREIILKNIRHSLIWILISLLIGVLVGLAGTAFAKCLAFVNSLRSHHTWLIYGLPFGAMIIVFLYNTFHNEKDTGTNRILDAIHAKERLPFRSAPLIYVSTLISHCVGASVGREGAALQMGGSLGATISHGLKTDEETSRIAVMCGMSAAFTALFGTPMASAIFAVEVASNGMLYEAGLLPSILSALTAKGIAVFFGLSAETYTIAQLPSFSILTSVHTFILAALCGVLSILFCLSLHKAERIMKNKFENKYLRAFAGGTLLLVMTLLSRSQLYNGSGALIIEECFETGKVFPLAFIIKALFTFAAISCGYKGGEIVPAFTVGAAFGTLYGMITGFSPTLCAAAGMLAVFCGATNCPLTSLLIGFEMFGYEAMPYFLLAVAVSYMTSGYFSLYHSQEFIVEKYSPKVMEREKL